MERRILCHPESECQGQVQGSREVASEQRIQPRKPPLKEPTGGWGNQYPFVEKKKKTKKLEEGFRMSQLIAWLLEEGPCRS